MGLYYCRWAWLGKCNYAQCKCLRIFIHLKLSSSRRRWELSSSSRASEMQMKNRNACSRREFSAEFLAYHSLPLPFPVSSHHSKEGQHVIRAKRVVVVAKNVVGAALWNASRGGGVQGAGCWAWSVCSNVWQRLCATVTNPETHSSSRAAPSPALSLPSLQLSNRKSSSLLNSSSNCERRGRCWGPFGFSSPAPASPAPPPPGCGVVLLLAWRPAPGPTCVCKLDECAVMCRCVDIQVQKKRHKLLNFIWRQ